jgi:hypothetical protein
VQTHAVLIGDHSLQVRKKTREILADECVMNLPRNPTSRDDVVVVGPVWPKKTAAPHARRLCGLEGEEEGVGVPVPFTAPIPNPCPSLGLLPLAPCILHEP